MRIKKTSQAVAQGYSVNGAYSESQSQAYSCDYVNSLNNYSTTEQVVGVWTNGKPLYRKLVTGVVPTTSASGTDVTGAILVANNIDEMIIEWGYVRANNTTTDMRKRQLPFITTSGYRVSLTSKCDSSGGASTKVSPFDYIAVSNNYAGYSGREIMVSVLYTKTTD